MSKADNADHEVLKGFVDRLFNVEQAFADTKAEYTDSKKDLKDEIKSRTDETGVTVAQVADLVKIRLNEAQALEEQASIASNMELYEAVYGFSAPPPSTLDDEEADAALA